MQALLRRSPAFAGAAFAAMGGLAAHSAYRMQTGEAVALAHEPALDPNAFKAFKLQKVEKVTHNTNLYRFALPHSDQTAGLPVASCLVVKAPIGEGGKAVIRPYTPVSTADAKSHLDLVVKVYEKGVMSKHFGSLKPGDTLEMKGPIMKIKYEPNMKESIGMVAGGTGITPMLQVLEHILANPNDRTKVHLVFANEEERDILLKPRLDALAKTHSGSFKVTYVVTRPPKGSSYPSGYVTKDLLKKHLPAPGPKSAVYVCGPPGFMEAVSGNKAKDYTQGDLTGILKDLGWTKDNVFKF